MSQKTQNVGPGLPAQYDEKEKGFVLPNSPFKRLAHNHLVVKTEGFVYKGLIAIPETAKRSSTAGIVVDAHKDCMYQRGQKVLYSQFAGYLFNFKTVSGLRVMAESEVLGELVDETDLEIESE